MINQISIQFSELPSSKILTLDDKEFELRFKHNARFDFISVEVYFEGDLIFTNKIVYGANIFQHCKEISTPVIPMSVADLDREGFSDLHVGKDTFGDSVVLLFQV